MVEIITLTSTLTNSCYYRVSTMLRGNIMDEFLHDNCLSYSCTSEETYLSSLEHRSDEIYYLDTGFKNLCLG